jgi:hypothetical protein
MPEINANFTVEPFNINITQTDPGIEISTAPINLNLFTGGYACAAGNTNEVQYNAGGFIAGSPNFLWYNSNSTLSATNILGLIQTAAQPNITSLGNLISLTVSGNITAGNVNAGNLLLANFLSGTLITAAQPNITSVGTLTSLNITGNLSAGNANLGNAVTANYFIGNGALLTGIDTSQISNGNSNVKVLANSNVTISSTGNANIVVITGTGANINGTLNVSANTNLANLTANAITSNGNIAFTGANVSLGNVANLEIIGGTNGYVLQTDGTGNLSWTAMTGNAGNGVVGGSNTQIQFNDAGAFGGSAGFTFDKTSNAFSAPGAANIVGNLTAGNANLGNNVSANYFTGLHNGSVINLGYGIENVSLITAQTGTYNFNIIDNGIRYTTSNASANLTLNLRGNSTISANTLLANGQSVSATYVLQNGNTAYTVSAVQIDGNAQTIKWVGGSTPTVVANAIHAFTFTVVKTATTPTYTVLGSLTRYA